MQTVRFTGLVLHEWLGLAMVGMVLAHLLLAWSWIASQSRRFFVLKSIRTRINYLLNLGLFAAVTAVIFSGILISQKAIPTLTAEGRTAFDPYTAPGAIAVYVARGTWTTDSANFEKAVNQEKGADPDLAFMTEIFRSRAGIQAE